MRKNNQANHYNHDHSHDHNGAVCSCGKVHEYSGHDHNHGDCAEGESSEHAPQANQSESEKKESGKGRSDDPEEDGSSNIIHLEDCTCGSDHNHNHALSHDHDHGDTCSCGHEHAEANFRSAGFIVGVVLFALGVILTFALPSIINTDAGIGFYLKLGIFFVSYILVGKEILLLAGKNILKGQVFDENFLMSIASLGAFAIGEFPEAVAVILFYRVGEYLQESAAGRSRASISKLMDIRPDEANLKTPSGIVTVMAEAVEVGDILIVKPGDKIPLDGIVEEGASSLDMKALTGESIPKDVLVGDEVLSGSINGAGLLTIKVEKRFSESTVSKILEMTEHASSKKAKTENFITKFAKIYTPIVVGIAALIAIIPPLILNMGPFTDWLYRALVFLVVSCPCALVISIPLGFFGGIGALSRRGMLVKGGNYLEALASVDTIVFDKTGTLTTGKFSVTSIHVEKGVDESLLLGYAACAESHSNHPIAISIIEAYDKIKEESLLSTENIDSIEEKAGYGVKAQIDNQNVFVGNERLMESENIHYIKVDSPYTIVHVAADGKYLGYLEISDTIKSDSKDAIAALKEIGIKKTIMLTGDKKTVAESVAGNLGVDEYFGELLPHDKVKVFEDIISEVDKNSTDSKKERKKKVAFVGDGINDAPVLARADIGIAMGGIGSDAAIEAADLVIMNDNPSQIATAIQVSRRTKLIVWENIVLSLGIKGVILVAAAFGFASMWLAVFADVGVALLAVLNAMRIR